MHNGELDSEVKLIDGANIRVFVRQCLDKAPDYFWTAPSSSTGKHHPKDENIKGGLVIHTKRTVKVAAHLCECLDIKGIEKDCVIAACIMHDLCKNGYPKNEEHTVDGHGFCWVTLVRTILTKNEIKDTPTFSTISRLILMHMGKYDLPYVLDWQDKLATCVHMADYIASREDIIVDINKKV